MGLATGSDEVTVMGLVTGGDAVTAVRLVTRGEEVAAVRLATGGDDVTAVRLVTGRLAEIRSTTAPRKQTSCTRHCGCCAPHVSGGNDEDGDWVTRNMLLCFTGFKGARAYLPTIYR